MGFRRNKTYALRWADGTEFAGLEVEARPLPIGAMDKFGPLIALKDRGDDFGPEDMDAITGMFQDFAADALVSWNFEDDEGDVPPTPEGMRRVDLEMGLAIITEWFTAVTGVSENSDGDLGKGSEPGASSPAVSIPMEPLSESPPS